MKDVIIKKVKSPLSRKAGTQMYESSLNKIISISYTMYE